MRPRLTPSTGISTLRASSAARRNVPSPPRTSTSSQPSAARSRRRRPPRSRRPCARMSSGARCSGPRSTASAESTRSPMPLSPSTFSTRRATSVASSRPVCTTSRMVRSQVIADPPSTARRTASSSALTSSGRSVLARSRRKYSTLPDGPGSGLAVTPTVCQCSSAARRATASTALRAQTRVVHHPARAHPVLADLELRLHHRNDIGVRRRARGQRRQHRRQRDERQIGDDEVDGPADRSPAVSSRTLVRSMTRSPGSSDAATRPAGRSRRRRRPLRGRRDRAAPR